MGRCDEAARDLGGFLERANPDDPRALEAATVRDACRAPAAPPPTASPSAPAVAPPVAAPAPSPVITPAVPPITAPPTAAPMTDNPSPRRRKLLLVAAIATGAVGVGLLAGGAYYGVRAQQLSNDVSNIPSGTSPTMPGMTPWSTDYDSGPADNRNMAILVAVGGAAVVTAAILAYVALRGGPESRSAARPLWTF
jgi:hypothetical protein